MTRKTDSRCSAFAGQRPCPQVVMTAVTEFRFEILSHPQYPTDTAPSDFYLYPKLKAHLRGTQYGGNEGVIEAVIECLRDHENAFKFESAKKAILEIR